LAAHRRETVPRTENALGTWPADLQVDLKRSQTGPQHDIRLVLCRVLDPYFPQCSSKWVRSQIRKIGAQYDLTLIRDLSGSHARTLRARSMHSRGTPRHLRGTRRYSEAPDRTSSWSYPRVARRPRAAIRGRTATRYATRAGALSYGAAVPPRCPTLVENVVEKDTFYMRWHAS